MSKNSFKRCAQPRNRTDIREELRTVYAGRAIKRADEPRNQKEIVSNFKPYIDTSAPLLSLGLCEL